mgnify:CR=1 FL=1
MAIGPNAIKKKALNIKPLDVLSRVRYAIKPIADTTTNTAVLGLYHFFINET